MLHAAGRMPAEKAGGLSSSDGPAVHAPGYFGRRNSLNSVLADGYVERVEEGRRLVDVSEIPNSPLVLVTLVTTQLRTCPRSNLNACACIDRHVNATVLFYRWFCDL